ncbi:DUF1538 domain-containing protein [Methanoculleus sp.]|uniref:DUF1538 domain-containing protein n=1 Tax=Methanoculleus sp. TaxID=90427 RepID=UPI0026342251|nr:DUF1538 domain-containing protein [Methanoculleus sp.]MDD2787967.1 DUF1538 domain-containing protein [Methanoculleus sp.]
MQRALVDKLKESAQSVLPIAAIVLLLHFTLAPLPFSTLMLFLPAVVLLILGMSAFTLGADMAVMPMGELIGAKLTESRNLWLMILISFLLGLALTLAEPDLQVLTRQVPAVPDFVLATTVAFGVGIFLVIAMLRILFQVRISHLFILTYALIFIVAAFTAPEYMGVGFDAGGVTTGPITVPFILALGAGVSAVRAGKSTEEDSFGLCALCSIGPILAVLIMGIFYDPTGTGYAFETPATADSIGELVALYAGGLVGFFKEVCLILLPIVVFFGAFQMLRLRLPRSQLIRIGVGLVYILLGLTIFLTGVYIGFMPAGTYLGRAIASLPYNWILIPLGLVIGSFIVAAEPAVHILNKQIEDLTNGAISRRVMMLALSIGVGIALVLAMIRILTSIEIWYFLVPGYAVALLLTFCVPQIFTAIAFDSGGVAAGTMAAAFLLPFALGATDAVGGPLLLDAFGIVGMVAMMPLITVQVIGLVYQIKLRRAKAAEKERAGRETFEKENIENIEL